MPHRHQPDDAQAADLPFLTLWYRFMFFDWMFRDLNGVHDLYERNAAAQHNRDMSRYLPTYLRRWSFVTLTGFALGCVFEQATKTSMLSAWFFTSSCVTLTGMVVISVAWAFLSHSGTQ